MTAALLYPTLHELEQDGLVSSEWEDGQGKRRRKYYTITDEGRKVLVSSRAEWERFISSLFKTLTPGGPYGQPNQNRPQEFES